MSKRKGDFRSKIDSILADDPAEARPDLQATGLDRMFGAQGTGESRQARDRLSRHVAPTTETKLDEIEIARIKLPRGRRVDADAELHASIAKTGILQPLLLRPTANGYEVLDGGRRLAVARERGLKTVPAVVRTIGNAEAKAMSAERKAPAVIASAPVSAAARRSVVAPPESPPAALPTRKPAPIAARPVRTPVRGRPVRAAGAAAIAGGPGVAAASKGPGVKAAAAPAAAPAARANRTRRPLVTPAAAAVPVEVASKAAERSSVRAAGRASAKPAGSDRSAATPPTRKAPAAQRVEESAAPKGARSGAKTRTVRVPARAAAALAPSEPREAVTAAPTRGDPTPAKAGRRPAAAGVARIAAGAAATAVAAEASARPGNSPARRRRAVPAPSAVVPLVEVADPDATLVTGGADETMVITRPAPAPAPPEVPEDAAGEPPQAEPVEPSAAAEETMVWRRPSIERPGDRPVAASRPAPMSPAFPRPALEPAQREVAASSPSRGTATAISGSTGKLLADWVAFPVAAGALAFAVTNLVFFNNLALFLESGAVCVLALAVFGVLYLAGRRA